MRNLSFLEQIYDAGSSWAARLLDRTIEPVTESVRGEPDAWPASVRAIKGEFKSLVPIQRGDGHSPLFMVHGAGGTVQNFADLGRGLGAEQTVFGIQAKSFDGSAYSTIEELAKAYLGEVLRVVPDGPYLLGGYSAGGVIAYEMAQQLVAMRKRVGLLAFFDTFHPGTKPRDLSSHQRLARVRREGVAIIPRLVVGSVQRRLELLRTELVMKSRLDRGLPLVGELRDIYMTRAFYGAADLYQPGPYAGNVLLFRARLIHGTYEHVGPKLGWDDLIPRLEVVEVPGGHDSLMLEPNAHVLASTLKRCIQQLSVAQGSE